MTSLAMRAIADEQMDAPDLPAETYRDVLADLAKVKDGQLSIARSFRPAEWRGLLKTARIDGSAAQVARRFPFRLCVERIR